MDKDGKLSPADAEKQAVQLGATEQLERGLKSRHLQFIAIGGTVGTGMRVVLRIRLLRSVVLT